MENGFVSSPARTDAFPAGLRVLVVDDDPTWLKILEKMLIKCSYEVTTCCLARNALDILRERKDGFDIVISDVNMPDMNGFKLLEHVGLEMDLPVIMMSVDGETSRVMKGVQHGACDYLLKPVRMKELRNIWQHVLRKKIHDEVKDIESLEGSEDTHRMMSNGFDEFDNSHLIIMGGGDLSSSRKRKDMEFQDIESLEGSEDTHRMMMSNGFDEFDNSHLIMGGGDLSSSRKRKDMEFQEYDDQDFNDPSAAKKTRVVWSVDLHQKFVKAVNMIGFDKVGPKKILDLMNVPWLSRENVASHLQKYRLYLSRLQKQNEPKITYGAISPPTSFGFQSSTTIHQNDVASSCSFDFSGSKNHIQDVCAKRHEGDKNDMSSFLPVTKTEKTFIDDVVGPPKASISSRMGIIPHSFGSLAQDTNYTTFGSSTIPQHISWGREIPAMQLIEEPIEELDPYQYSYLPLPGSQPQIQVDQPQSAPFITPGTSITERDTVVPSELIKPLSLEYRGNHVRNVSATACTSDLFSVHLPEADTVNSQAFGTMFTRLPSISHSFDQNFISNLEPHQQSFILGSGLNLASSHEELQVCCSLHDYGCCIETAGINSREILNCNSSEPITELPSHFYEGLRFSSDYLIDNTLDYPIMDQGLFSIHSMIS